VNARSTREDKRNSAVMKVSWNSAGYLVQSFTGDGSTRQWNLPQAIAGIETITVNNGAPKSVGNWPGDSNSDFSVEAGRNVVYQNTTATALTSADALRVAYYPLAGNITAAEDDADRIATAAAEGGGSGRYQGIYDLTGDTSVSFQDAYQEGLSLVATDESLAVEFNYDTDQAIQPSCLGLRPGQTQTVNLPYLGLNGAYLVDSVTFKHLAGLYFSCTIRALNGVYLGNWIDYFRGLTGSTAVLGGGGTLSGGSGASTVTGPTPDVRFYDAGSWNQSNGTFSHSLTWDLLNQRIVVDFGCALPSDLSNWSGMALFIVLPSGVAVQACDLITASQFTSASGGIVYYYYGSAALSGALPNPPQTWTLVACSFNHSGLHNQDSNGRPTGPSVAIATPVLKTPPSFDPPGPVVWADFQTQVTDRNLLVLTAEYDPPATGGPTLGVQVSLSRPSLSDEDLGAIDMQGAGRQYITQSHSTPASTENWTLKFTPYGANHAGSTANVVSVTHSVGPYPNSTQIAAGVTAVPVYSSDSAGNPLYGFDTSFPVPSDPNFATCRIVAVFDADPTREIRLGETNSGTAKFVWWPGVPVVTVKFYAINQSGQVNTTAAPSVHFTVLFKGNALTGPGYEWAPVVTGFSANIGYTRDDAGNWRYYFYGSLTPSLDIRYQGVQLNYLPNGGTVPIQFLAITDGTTSWKSASYPCPAGETGIVYACSMDANNPRQHLPARNHSAGHRDHTGYSRRRRPGIRARAEFLQRGDHNRPR
jgi:hypothetical protein